MPTKILFRTDALDGMGLGHLIRCIALADMLKEHFDCVFVIREDSSKAAILIKQAAYKFSIIPVLENHSAEAVWFSNNMLTKNEIVVLDGYAFDTDYQKTVKAKAAKLVCIDDIYAYPFVADVLINHAGDADAEKYETAGYTKLCLGSKYSLLRAPFLKAAKEKRRLGKIETAFVCLGGMDTSNQLISVLGTLIERLPNLRKCIVITGSSYGHKPALAKYIAHSKVEIDHQENVGASDIVELMKESQIGICTPSGISYEYACVGGGLFLLQTADNQNGIRNFLLQESAADLLENLTTDYDIEMHLRNQRTLFDGLVGRRFVGLFRNLERVEEGGKWWKRVEEGLPVVCSNSDSLIVKKENEYNLPTHTRKTFPTFTKP
ncbi:MAG: UDP-2,4-diacetamido-2,4,6-trideoxy-beta-L-altropyranose hydrolase [Saprospiraceae bacterium]